jgi:hypothetical protein
MSCFYCTLICNLTRFVAERGVYASEVKTGKFMRQFLDQGLALYLKVRLT